MVSINAKRSLSYFPSIEQTSTFSSFSKLQIFLSSTSIFTFRFETSKTLKPKYKSRSKFRFLEIKPIDGVKEIPSVDIFSFSIFRSSRNNNGSIKENKFSEIAGAKTEPPPSVPTPISFIPKKTLIAVPLEEPVIANPVIGFFK